MHCSCCNDLIIITRGEASSRKFLNFWVYNLSLVRKTMAMMNKLSAMTVYQVQVLRNGPCDNFSLEEPNHFSPFSSVHMIFTFFNTNIVEIGAQGKNLIAWLTLFTLH